MTDYLWYTDLPLITTSILLLICSYFDFGFQQCTENFWADQTLNGGRPQEDTLGAYVNMYSWPGWIEMLIWSIGLEIWYGAWMAMASGSLAALLWL